MQTTHERADGELQGDALVGSAGKQILEFIVGDQTDQVITAIFAPAQREGVGDAAQIAADIAADDVVEGFKKFGFEILEEHNKDNWYAFVCRKGE